ncbi:phosphoribosylanthranilate isomerase [Enterovirga aerilata]|uniref:N-(5'-phosphoribosyl)anthranilate isomerase n=1 Tax=Enterovirga aerilata TaxID=2730920 RepID=A0A849I461_9HYPH|nr:phosphoribosylanthranilate isomerase [Enterovirga sp. DB1703]NNM71169.1 phosphoribosylanthranilate isomerase [Enterovirga sp. DB1703]
MIKICGLSTPATLEAAIAAGADMVGFVRFPRSPRHLELEHGRELSALARGRARRVLLLVDPSDRELDEAVAALDPDIVQLHGSEAPGRVAAIQARTGRPVMKALGIAEAEDLGRIAAYRGVADGIILDAKAPRGSALPGGNGLPFDWSLLAGLDPRLDVMLSGGLDPANVAEAIAATRVRAVDVSSGVESRPGVKDPEKIAAFVQAARAAFAAAQQDRTEP